MAARLFRLSIGCFAGICVLLLFFFPLVHGPFQATHGPTTAFRARKAFLILLLSIASAAHGVLSRIRAAQETAFHGSYRKNEAFPDLLSSGEAAILRC
jgi:hypothetical protein